KDDRSTNRAPSLNWSWTRCSSPKARRVLPTPPGPESVRSRTSGCDSCFNAAPRSCSRPISCVGYRRLRLSTGWAPGRGESVTLSRQIVAHTRVRPESVCVCRCVLIASVDQSGVVLVGARGSALAARFRRDWLWWVLGWWLAARIAAGGGRHWFNGPVHAQRSTNVHIHLCFRCATRRSRRH